MRTLLSVLIGISLFFVIFNNWNKFTSRYDINYWQEEFSVSQVVMGDKAKHFFPDGDLYAILGIKYLHGANPIYLHPEVPPLGKQLIALGILGFGNENISSLVFGLLSLIIFFYMGLLIFKNVNWSLFVVLVITLNSEFRLLMTNPNLDIFQLFFLALGIFSLIKGLENKKYFLVTAICIGFIMATKFYFNGLIFMMFALLYLFIQSNFKTFINFIYSLPLALIGYSLPYYNSFLANPNPIFFLKFQKWLTFWWAGNARVPPGRAIPMILTGKWETWWEGPQFIRIEEWNLLWPIITIIGLLSIFVFKRRQDNIIFAIWLWSSLYLIFICLTTPFPRYFVAIFPFLSILTVFAIYRIKATIKHE